jgi:hypothetical protein
LTRSQSQEEESSDNNNYNTPNNLILHNLINPLYNKSTPELIGINDDYENNITTENDNFLSNDLPTKCRRKDDQSQSPPSNQIRRKNEFISTNIRRPTSRRDFLSNKNKTANYSDSELDSMNLNSSSFRYNKDDYCLKITKNGENDFYFKPKSEDNFETFHLDALHKQRDLAWHEEKLYEIQKSHDDKLQKIINRKNNEIEEIKQNYRKITKNNEDKVNKLERKINLITKEKAAMEEKFDKHVKQLQ